MVGLSGYSVVSEQFRFPKGKQEKIPVFHGKMATTRNKFTEDTQKGAKAHTDLIGLILFATVSSTMHDVGRVMMACRRGASVVGKMEGEPPHGQS